MDGGKPAVKEGAPSAPSQHPAHPTTKISDQDTTLMGHVPSAVTAKKFAKTLRLTSDQLVSICWHLLFSLSYLVCELAP